MAINFSNEQLLNKIKIAMERKDINTKKLSEATNINKSTISKILNNKQKVNINHLSKISTVLDIPLEELLILSGYNLDLQNTNKVVDNENNFNDIKFDNIDDILEFTKFINCSQLEKDVKKELKKYEAYLKTSEGENLLKNEFENKINSIGFTGVFVDKLKELYIIFIKKDLKEDNLLLIGSMLLYFIISTDIIPDFIFPIGFLDDMIALKFVLDKIYINNKNS